MRYLLDSHALIWSVDAPDKLGISAHAAIQNSANELLVSAATPWEISIKCGLRKLHLAPAFREWMNQAILDIRASILPISVEHAAVQASLPWHHRDPFDRLLIAQSQAESLTLISQDVMFDRYGITRLW